MFMETIFKYRSKQIFFKIHFFDFEKRHVCTCSIQFHYITQQAWLNSMYYFRTLPGRIDTSSRRYYMSYLGVSRKGFHDDSSNNTALRDTQTERVQCGIWINYVDGPSCFKHSILSLSHVLEIIVTGNLLYMLFLLVDHSFLERSWIDKPFLHPEIHRFQLFSFQEINTFYKSVVLYPQNHIKNYIVSL